MNDCKSFRRYLVAWLDAELNAGASAEARAHFAWCQPCRDYALPYVRQQQELESVKGNPRMLSEEFWGPLNDVVASEMGPQASPGVSSSNSGRKSDVLLLSLGASKLRAL